MDWIFLHEVRQANENKYDLDRALKVDFWPAKRHGRNPVGFLTANDFAEWGRRNLRRALRLIVYGFRSEGSADHGLLSSRKYSDSKLP